MSASDKSREEFVERQIASRGVRDRLVLDAMRAVPRELFIPQDERRHAYDDSPLPIGGGQTISQPYIVAFMVEALGLQGGEKVLEVGAGSGYAAAILSKIAGEVFTIERLGALAKFAADNLASAECTNVHVRHGDGTQGWEEAAPFDAILVSAGGPDVPRSLMHQLKIGGRLVIPVGDNPRAQELVRVTRTDDSDWEREDIADVRFVPLIGKEGWEDDGDGWQHRPPRVVRARPSVSLSVPELIRTHGEPFERVENADLAPLLARIGDARVVAIGEATHGTSEFYRLRARITQKLIAEKGFDIVAIEADWPDAHRIDHYVRQRDVPPAEWTAFARFPTWMWRNAETREFVDWLHTHNQGRPYAQRAAFYGLDLYSLYTSIRAVLGYLDSADPSLARIARERYGCLSPWEADLSSYGRASLPGSYHKCEEAVAHILVELLQKRQELADKDGERFFDASQNARLVADAEAYYRTMYYGSRASWNIRDTHMFETLQQALSHRGPQSKAVIWAHNSHIGDASATEMGRRGEHNIGQLARVHYGDAYYAIGFGTDHGTVAAAEEWDSPMRVMRVRASHAQSYERLFQLTRAPGLMLPLRSAPKELRQRLAAPRLQRAIGVIYRPDSELASHYFETNLMRQFDEYIWIERTHAIAPLEAQAVDGLPDTYPFGL